MALVLSGDDVGYGCSEHGFYVYRNDCMECVALFEDAVELRDEMLDFPQH